ncbi:MAG: hypothetical protein DMG25_17955 [Acidobacteria bacterium]|nr:MAG: hypothetical protein DMG25_17955 [Acidobacteriota bacterium]
MTGPYSGCEPKLPPPNAESRIPAKWLPACLACAVGLALVALRTIAGATPAERTSVNVLVKDAETDQPIYQARLTLRFQEPRRFKRSKSFSFSAKTNAQGRYRFTLIPKGTVRLTVTAEHHQTFSKEFEVDQDNEVLEVKLKPPQPLL